MMLGESSTVRIELHRYRRLSQEMKPVRFKLDSTVETPLYVHAWPRTMHDQPMQTPTTNSTSLCRYSKVADRNSLSPPSLSLSLPARYKAGS